MHINIVAAGPDPAEFPEVKVSPEAEYVLIKTSGLDKNQTALLNRIISIAPAILPMAQRKMDWFQALQMAAVLVAAFKHD